MVCSQGGEDFAIEDGICTIFAFQGFPISCVALLHLDGEAFPYYGIDHTELTLIGIGLYTLEITTILSIDRSWLDRICSSSVLGSG